MKDKILEKTQRKLANNFPDYDYDDDLLGDYFEDAVSIIKDWKRNQNDTVVLSGLYDRQIVQFIIESLNMAGIEGQSTSSANGVTKSFISSPESNLKASIPQSI